MKSVMNYINRHSVADIVGNDRTRKYISQVLFYICLAVYMTASLLQYTSIKSGYSDFNKLLTQIIGYCVYVAILNVI